MTSWRLAGSWHTASARCSNNDFTPMPQAGSDRLYRLSLTDADMQATKGPPIGWHCEAECSSGPETSAMNDKGSVKIKYSTFSPRIQVNHAMATARAGPIVWRLSLPRACIDNAGNNQPGEDTCGRGEVKSTNVYRCRTLAAERTDDSARDFAIDCRSRDWSARSSSPQLVEKTTTLLGL